MRVALGVEYDGRGFCGWQTQPAGCGVQDALQRSLARIAGHPVDVVCAGRTDAGVHARGQVVHFDTIAERPETAWTRGVNASLPDGVSVLWARPVDNAFHARFDALARAYRYTIQVRSARPALEHGRVGWWPTELDLECMCDAAAHLVGTHDFSAFRAAECQARSPVRTLEALRIRRRGDLLFFDLRANAFLHHMVRNIVGSLVYVGAGRRPEEWIRAILESRDRRLAAPTFAPDGLCLQAVYYDAKVGLPVPDS
ncbi:MAG: tRNA pseudouridine(38-40) synthase TruA [Betaproteobacteria bacterium]|nr:tRNA pseudouridine(38-40) synthase TruA [Betaproteobacteria bacterium]